MQSIYIAHSCTDIKEIDIMDRSHLHRDLPSIIAGRCPQARAPRAESAPAIHMACGQVISPDAPHDVSSFHVNARVSPLLRWWLNDSGWIRQLPQVLLCGPTLPAALP